MGILSFQSSDGQSFRAMSYNIRYDNPSDGLNDWNHRRDFLIDQVLSSNPDILGIQESLPGQIEYIAGKLKGYGHVGGGRDEDGTGESTTIFYRTTRFELKEHHMFWLSETPDQMSKGWDAAIRRICTYVLLYDKEQHHQFWVFNTHFDHVGKEARLQSARLILARMKSANVSHLPVILMGDFNATPESDPIKELASQMKDARVVAVTKAEGPVGSFNGFDSTKPATQLIDHIYVSNEVHVSSYMVILESRDSRYPSDHFPVRADLVIQKK
jgi:endonuclease/exonuclease/phosphatase family metal-dependent hydrolase